MPDQTKLDLLLERIQQWKELLAQRSNPWDELALQQLEAEVQKFTDSATGEALPIPPAESDLTVQFSPPEVLNAEGYWNIVPRGFGIRVPEWITRHLKNPAIGLDVSNARSDGCVAIKNQVDVSERWINDSAEVAKKYGTTARLIAMAGYQMRGKKYMLPMLFDTGVFEYENFVPEFEVPPNAEEQRVWSENFRFFSFKALGFFGGVDGGHWSVNDPFYHAADPDPTKRQQIDNGHLHKIVTVPNSPHLIILTLMSYFNSHMFKRAEWSIALHKAHEIDKGRAIRVPGYETPPVTKSNLIGYYDQFEDGASKAVPKFAPGGTD